MLKYEIDWTNIAEMLADVEARIEKETPGNMSGNMNSREFNKVLTELLVSKDGYVCDTGNYMNANYAIVYRLIDNIQRHPLLWKLFFMVA